MADWDWWPRFHDPSLRLSLRDQVAVHWDANVRMLRDWRACWTFVWISLLPVPLLAVAVVAVTSTFAAPAARLPVALGIGLVMLATYGFLQHVAFSVAMRRTYVPLVRMALAARGHPTCVACGHLLGPGAPAACPECGSATSGNG
jgi:hypothetical protein